MQPVYLLLRNNQQSGPYTLEELLKSGLKPDDLLWIEGKSRSWFYPSELETVRPHIPAESTKAKGEEPVQKLQESYIPSGLHNEAAKSKNTKKVFVSLPNKMTTSVALPKENAPQYSFDQKASELKNRVQMYATSHPSLPDEDAIKTNYSRSLDDVEEAYSSWIYSQKTKAPKKLSGREWAIAVVATLIVITGFIIYYQTSTKKENTATPISLSQNEKGEENSFVAAPAETVPQQVVTTSSPVQVVPEKITRPHTAYAITKESAKATLEKATKNKIPIIEDKEQQEESAVPAIQDNQPTVIGNEPEKPATGEKKKKFGEKINGFFDKLKHKNETAAPAEGGERTSIPSGTSERKATHRSDETAAAQENINIADQVDVTANEPSNSWMMGIKGLKITLRNRSTETIKSAAVEVRYYNEQNELLDKKMIHFTNVPAKKSVTLPAPDHSVADHTDYHLVSVTNE